MIEKTLNEKLEEMGNDPAIKQAVDNLKHNQLLQTAEELKTCAVVVKQLIWGGHNRAETKEYLSKLIAKAEHLNRKL